MSYLLNCGNRGVVEAEGVRVKEETAEAAGEECTSVPFSDFSDGRPSSELAAFKSEADTLSFGDEKGMSDELNCAIVGKNVKCAEVGFNNNNNSCNADIGIDVPVQDFVSQRSSIVSSNNAHSEFNMAGINKVDEDFNIPMPSGDRLVIRNIEVENFKSYYGKHIIGPFHSTFSAVIGPNGSGKSNIIDSLLFIFGRNAKKIRLEKLSEVIHNSSAHPDVTYASVSVNFVRLEEKEKEAANKNSEEEGKGNLGNWGDNVREVPGSELKIKREVFRSGTTQYFINGKKKTQREVIERLIKEGVDLEHNRFLILQGEVEQIALMKPKAEKEGEEGLLEYLDDLIGTNEFVEKISEATKRSESLQMERLEALDKKKVLLAEREALDDAKNSTLAFVTKDNHLQKTLVAMCQLRMQSVEAKLVEPRRILAEMDERIETIKKDVEMKLEEKKKMEGDLSELKKEFTCALTERDSLRKKKQKADAEVEEKKLGEEEQGRKKKKIEDQLNKAREDLQKAEIQQHDAEREGAIHQENLRDATTRIETLQGKIEAKLEEIQPIIAPLHKDLEAKKKACAPSERAVVECTEKVNTIKNRLTVMEQKKISQHEGIQKLESALHQNKGRLREIEDRLRLAENNEQNEEIQKWQDAAAEAARKKYSINGSIQELKNMYLENEAHDRATVFLRSQRNLKGYFGTLRQLGRIPDSYDVAAGVGSNAWGFHVVDNRETARQVLHLLKVNNIGRATVMVLSEIRREIGTRMDSPFKCPNNKCKRLFDLIKPTDADYRCAFYQAVRDTLVVDTLSDARETAFGSDSRRYRVVTLKGELIEPSGTITGGGSAPKGAKLKAAHSPQDLSSAKVDLQRLQSQLIEAAEEERKAQEILNNLKNNKQLIPPEERKALRLEYSQLSAVIENDAKQRATLLDEMEKNNAHNKQARTSLLSQLEEEQEGLERAQKDRLAQYSAVEQLEREINAASGSSYQSMLSELKEQQGVQDSEEQAARESRKLAQKLRATQDRKRRDVTELESKLQQLENDATSDGSKRELLASIKKQEEIAELLQSTEYNCHTLQEKVDAAKALLPKLNASVLESQKRLDDENRYRQTEAVKMADALQELAKFEQKIEGCEEKIRENAEQYGVETLQLEQTEEEDGENEEENECEEENDDEEQNDDESEATEDDPYEESGEADNPSVRNREYTAALRRNRLPHTSKRSRSVSDRVSEANSGRSGPRTTKKKKRKEYSPEAIRSMSFRLSPEALQRCDYDRLVHLAKALSDESKRLHGEIDFRAVALWRERDQAHRRACDDYELKRLASDEAEKVLNALKNERKKIFMQYFNLIQKRLKEVYQLLTHGGDADMELVDMNDPFEGIYFIVRPPKKSWKQISNLSGGEKTLSSLALIFSLHYIKPTPIYVMDEIDAALDYRNVTIVANYVLNQAVGAQFIIISLRNHMFEMAHQLVGVCKVNDMTRTLVLHPKKFQESVHSVLYLLALKKNKSTMEAEEPPEQGTPLSPCAAHKRPLVQSAADALETLTESSLRACDGRADSHRSSDNIRKSIKFIDPAEKENQNTTVSSP